MSCACNWKRKPQVAISQSSKCSLLPTVNWRLVMKTKAKRRAPRLPGTYSEAQLAGVKQSTTARRLATVERLQAATVALNATKQTILVQPTTYERGFLYPSTHRN